MWSPFGAAQAITGSLTMNGRFPGQWFQIESGLHWNWHRHYDPTTGRYLQVDPLGMAALLSDGPSVYGYGGQSPISKKDILGLRLRGHRLRGHDTQSPIANLATGGRRRVATCRAKLGRHRGQSEAIQSWGLRRLLGLDCFASLAMTERE